MSISSEKLRKVLHPIQIDTMHFRFKPRRNPGSQSQHRSVNRTAVTDGDHLPPPKAEKGVPFLVISNVRTQTINYRSQRWVPRSYYEALDPSRRPSPGDLLYTLVGSFGIPVEVLDRREFCVQRHIGIIRPAQWISNPFLARIMASKFIFDQADACATVSLKKRYRSQGCDPS